MSKWHFCHYLNRLNVKFFSKFCHFLASKLPQLQTEVWYEKCKSKRIDEYRCEVWQKCRGLSLRSELAADSTATSWCSKLYITAEVEHIWVIMKRTTSSLGIRPSSWHFPVINSTSQSHPISTADFTLHRSPQNHYDQNPTSAILTSSTMQRYFLSHPHLPPPPSDWTSHMEGVIWVLFWAGPGLFTGTLDSVWSRDPARPTHLQDQYAGFKAAGFTENTLLLIYRNF